jgi:hypothetical protein
MQGVQNMVTHRYKSRQDHGKKHFYIVYILTETFFL